METTVPRYDPDQQSSCCLPDLAIGSAEVTYQYYQLPVRPIAGCWWHKLCFATIQAVCQSAEENKSERRTELPGTSSHLTGKKISVPLKKPQHRACMNPPTTRPCWEIFSVGNRSAPWLHSGSFVSSPWLGRTFIELIPCWFPAQWIYHLRIYFYQSFTVLLGCWGNCGQTFQLHSLYWARRPRWKDLALWNCCHGQISSPWSSRPTFNVWILHFFFAAICLTYECGLG